MQVGELFVALGFDVDDTKLKSFNEGIKSSMNDLLKMSGVAAGAVYSINKFIEDSLYNSAALRQFTAETGESTEALKKWQVAAQLANPEMSIDEVTAAFKRMNSAITEAQYSGAKGGIFSQLGIDNAQNKTSAQLLDELRQNFSYNVKRWGLPKTLDFMEQLGVPKSMARTFQMSDEDIERMTRGLTITQKQTQEINNLSDALRRVSMEWQHFKDETTAQYSNKLIEFLENTKASVKSLYENFESFTQHSDEYSGGLKLIAGSAGLIVAALFPLTSALVAFVALFNDIGAYARGAPSYIGDTIDFFKGKGTYKPQKLDEFMAGGGTFRDVDKNGNTIQMNNTYHIQSTADPKGVADEVVQTQQQQLNRAYSGLNRGGY